MAALTAWAVVTATHRHQQRALLLTEARRAAVEMLQLAGRFLGMLERAREDRGLPVPNTEGSDWLVAASGVEIAMFSLPGDMGARISHDLGAARSASWLWTVLHMALAWSAPKSNGQVERPHPLQTARTAGSRRSGHVDSIFGLLAELTRVVHV
ncbi:hypothetical protein [Streptomyces sp. NPDC087859]|uniref:hypothetical protein n=1 Tax=Streptomyces sp. NPDC087859 TaxID=3365812 RepID=UPI0038205932